ncbi:hypothetical protein KY289_001267 [Solanum tuberosum]|nr:hypothetical protein KY289_001267 [Solanum tuberosum]
MLASPRHSAFGEWRAPLRTLGRITGWGLEVLSSYGITTKLFLLELLLKVKIPYNWVVLREPVLTHDKLWRREIHMVSRCYLCGQSVEAVNHLKNLRSPDKLDYRGGKQHTQGQTEKCSGDNKVTTPLLKFVAEFVLNKSQRLNFETSSPCGILLFREVSKLIVAYGSRILSLPNHVDMYQFKYKGVWISLTILSRALAGNYVNFGVFEIYGDRALADAFDIAMRMTLSIPLADILSYRKLSGAYFTFLEIMMKNQIQLILNLDSSSFTFIAGSLESGLKVLDENIKSQCASAVDNLATFYFEHITTGESPTTPVALNLAQHLADCPNIFLEKQHIGGTDLDLAMSLPYFGMELCSC